MDPNKRRAELNTDGHYYRVYEKNGVKFTASEWDDIKRMGGMVKVAYEDTLEPHVFPMMRKLVAAAVTCLQQQELGEPGIVQAFSANRRLAIYVAQIELGKLRIA